MCKSILDGALIYILMDPLTLAQTGYGSVRIQRKPPFFAHRARHRSIAGANTPGACEQRICRFLSAA